jgi:hypothetical protein
MGELSLSITTWSVVLGVLALALTVWLSVRLWRRTGGSRWVAVLETLRLLVVVLVLFTLLRPELVQKIRRFRRPELVVLYDESGSMNTRDLVTGEGEPEMRNRWIAQQLERKFWGPLEERYKVSVDGFSRMPDEAGKKEEGADAPEEGTDINRALLDAVARYRDMRTVILLTDGDWNLGESPVNAATRLRTMGVPVFCVALGSDRYLPDLDLEDVKAPSFCLLGEHVSIPFTIRSHLPRDVRTRVSVVSETGTEAQKEVLIPAQSVCQDTVLWQARELGEHTLALRVPVEPEEKVATNNQRMFRIAVRTETLKVLVIDSEPRWEYRFLRNALSRDPGVEVDCLMLHPALKPGEGPDYIQKFPGTREKMSQYDVIFLGDIGMGPKELSAPELELVKGVVEKQGSGLVFLAGRRGRQLTLERSPVGDMMPIAYDPARPKGIGLGVESKWMLTGFGQDHLLTMLADSPGASRMVWRQLPGFYWFAAVQRTRPGSRTLAVHSTMRNQWGRLPLLVIRPYGSGLVLWMGTDSAWRWRRGVEDLYHYRFWGQVVRWMAHKRHMAHERGVRLFFTPENPATDDTVFLQATVLDAVGMPIEGDQVTIEVVREGERVERLELTPDEGGWGIYRGSFVPKRGGQYALKLTSRRTGRFLDTKLDVAPRLREKVGQPARYSTLREIARITDGAFVTHAGLDSVIEKVSALPEQVQLEKRIRIWSQWWWGSIILGLATLYWVGRKLLGLI